MSWLSFGGFCITLIYGYSVSAILIELPTAVLSRF